jgi:hypothetical protein
MILTSILKANPASHTARVKITMENKGPYTSLSKIFLRRKKLTKTIISKKINTIRMFLNILVIAATLLTSKTNKTISISVRNLKDKTIENRKIIKKVIQQVSMRL